MNALRFLSAKFSKKLKLENNYRITKWNYKINQDFCWNIIKNTIYQLKFFVQLILMEKIEIIKKAISESELYSNNQCKVLNLLLDIAVNNVAQATVRFIEEKTGVKKPTIYFALKIFQKDGLIIKNERLGGFEIQQSKLNYFLESYQKKQSI